MTAVLSPLCEFTILLAGEKVTASVILPLLHHIQDTILANKPGKLWAVIIIMEEEYTQIFC